MRRIQFVTSVTSHSTEGRALRKLVNHSAVSNNPMRDGNHELSGARVGNRRTLRTNATRAQKKTIRDSILARGQRVRPDTERLIAVNNGANPVAHSVACLNALKTQVELRINRLDLTFYLRMKR